MTAQHPHHLGRFQAAGMASMFPPNPMFNLPTHHSVPTTPPKQSKSKTSSQTTCPAYSTPPAVSAAAAAMTASTAAVASGSNHKTSATSLARLQQLTNGLENQDKPSRPNSALLAPGYYPQQPSHAAGQATAAQQTHAAGQATAAHDARMMHQYSQNHMLNYTGYPGYLNPYMNMYHHAAVTDHHGRAAATHHQAQTGAAGAAPPHHQQMYPGYPALPYQYHR